MVSTMTENPSYSKMHGVKCHLEKKKINVVSFKIQSKKISHMSTISFSSKRLFVHLKCYILIQITFEILVQIYE